MGRMTDRYDTLKVVFDQEIREDDLQEWIQAIRMLRNVIEVIPVASTDVFGNGGYYRARHEFQMKLYELARDFK